MNKKQVGITLGIMCCVLTASIAVQIRTMNSANSEATQTLVDNDLRDNVLKWKEKYDNMAADLQRAEKKLEETRQKATANDTTAAAKEEELRKNNTLLGLTTVKGSGVVIEFADGKSDNSIFAIEDLSDKLVHYDDLLEIVNELRNSRVEAIEINGQRIINTSAITCEGNIIKINGEIIGSPFTIKAIGSPSLLQGQLTRPGSYLSTMVDRGIELNLDRDVRQEDNIVIKKYDGTLNFKYVEEK